MQEPRPTLSPALEQLLGAAGNAAKQVPTPKGARRSLAAMFYAQRSDCTCDACRLLRAEVQDLLETVIGTLASHVDSDDSSAPADGATG